LGQKKTGLVFHFVVSEEVPGALRQWWDWQELRKRETTDGWQGSRVSAARQSPIDPRSTDWTFTSG